MTLFQTPGPALHSTAALMDLVAAGVIVLARDNEDGIWHVAFANKAFAAQIPAFAGPIPASIAAACADVSAGGGSRTVSITEAWDLVLNPLSAREVIGTMAPSSRGGALAESLVAAIYSIADIGMCVTDRQRRFVRVNPAYTRLYGWSEEELVGNEFTIVLPPEFRDAASELHDAYLDGKTDESPGEWRVRTKDGRIVPILVTAARMVLPDGRRYKVTTVIDITDVKEREAELERQRGRAEALERTKSDFFANMSHELRTPLNALLGFSELMTQELHGPVGDPRYLDYVKLMRSSAEHLLSLVNDILDFEKLSQQRLQLARERVMFCDIVAEAAALCQASGGGLARELPVRVETLLLPMRVPVDVDRRALLQVLVNLIGNAVKYSPAGAVVSLRVRREQQDNVVALDIIDSGPGMTAEEIARIGEPFQRGPIAVKRAMPGTGLGLAIVSRLIEVLGGSVSFSSPPEGGLRVTLRLPFAPSEPPSEPSLESSP